MCAISTSSCSGADAVEQQTGARLRLAHLDIILDMDDAITRYRAASEANDIDALMATLSPDVEVVSPISGRLVFRGSDDVRFLLSAVYGCVSNLRWTLQLSDGASSVLVGGLRRRHDDRWSALGRWVAERRRGGGGARTENSSTAIACCG